MSIPEGFEGERQLAGMAIRSELELLGRVEIELSRGNFGQALMYFDSWAEDKAKRHEQTRNRLLCVYETAVGKLHK